MKQNSLKQIKFSWFLFAFLLLANFLLCSAFSPFVFNDSYVLTAASVNEDAPSQGIQEDEIELPNYSIFMNTPTYSFEYEDYLYFVDSSDLLLKIYNKQRKQFELENLSLNVFLEIFDATYLDGYLILIGSRNKSYDFDSDESGRIEPNALTDYLIEIIDIKNFTVLTTICSEELNENYIKISALILDHEPDKKDIYIAVTPTAYTDEVPVLVFAAEDMLSVYGEENVAESSLTFSTCKVILSGATFNNYKENLYKILLMQSDENNIRFIFIYKLENVVIGSANITKTELKSSDTNTKTYNVSNFNSHLNDTTHEAGAFLDANMMYHNETNLLLISFSESQDENLQANSGFSYLYSCKFGTSDSDNIVEWIQRIDTAAADSIIATGSCIYFTDTDPSTQDEYIKKITLGEKSSSGNSYSASAEQFTNPEIKITWYDKDEYIYVETSNSTLKNRPWSGYITQELVDVNLVVVGKASMLSAEEAIEISDYYYCLYTSETRNYFGFVKVSDTNKKEIRPVGEYKYKVFKVLNGTKLYSHPTKFEGSLFGDNPENLNDYSSVIMQIDGNLPVEARDLICYYSANGEVMMKICVNGTEIGYIEEKMVVAPKDKNNFVITDSSIKGDGTKVYLYDNANSPIIGVLKKGYRVRVNGSRTSKNGFINITYNDEYGNEFTGYIMTDLVETDTWTLLQIIGFILIAINIGLLILILHFKRTKIGYAGQKYDNSKKPITTSSSIDDIEEYPDN